jgi:hypothetical protein
MPDKTNQLIGDYTAWAQRCGVAPWEEVRPKGNGQKKNKKKG